MYINSMEVPLAESNLLDDVALDVDDTSSKVCVLLAGRMLSRTDMIGL